MGGAIGYSMEKIYTICNINGEYLDTYGPTKEEISFITGNDRAFYMTEEQAKARIKIVNQYFPGCHLFRKNKNH